jgi:hypothetical protein
MNSLINRKYILIIHALVVGPLLTYIGYMKTKTHNNIFNLLLVLGVVVGLYHLYLLFNNYSSKNINWLHVFHVLYVAPLLIYIAINKGRVKYPLMDILFILGIGVTILMLLKLSK